LITKQSVLLDQKLFIVLSFGSQISGLVETKVWTAGNNNWVVQVANSAARDKGHTGALLLEKW
jgi:hypothetical protein